MPVVASACQQGSTRHNRIWRLDVPVCLSLHPRARSPTELRKATAWLKQTHHLGEASYSLLCGCCRQKQPALAMARFRALCPQTCSSSSSFSPDLLCNCEGRTQPALCRRGARSGQNKRQAGSITMAHGFAAVHLVGRTNLFEILLNSFLGYPTILERTDSAQIGTVEHRGAQVLQV